jgi:NitT/TauT family transport system substrate-binding protein
MLTRRHAVQVALAAIGSPSATRGVQAQRKPLVKVRYSEVIRSVFFAPAYVAIAKGFFEETGLDIALTTANAPDRLIAGLLGGSADIGLVGPDAAIYVLNSESPTKARIFCGLTATDGFMLVGREKVDKFDWGTPKGKEILAGLPGGTPLMFLQAALRLNGLDPLKDVKLVTNVAPPARVGSWLAGQNQYATFAEPDASQLELDGKAYFLASIGQTVGFADYTAFIATDRYISDNPDVVQGWTDAIYNALQWIAVAPVADIVETLKPYFPGITTVALTAGVERYRQLKMWKTTPVIDPSAIEKFQDILVQGNVLGPAKRVTFADLVRAEFASRAK